MGQHELLDVDGDLDHAVNLLAQHDIDAGDLYDNVRAGVASGFLTENKATNIIDVAFSHPIKLIANALGVPPRYMLEMGKERGVATAALVGANVLDFQDVIRLVAERGRLMQEAVPEGEGAMAAIIGLSDDQVILGCKEVSAATRKPVEPVNFNSPGQIVIAGATEAVEKAIEMLQEEGAKRALKLPVSVPSHSSLMKPAADEMAKVLATVTINKPDVQVIHNYDARSHDEPDAIREALTMQICSPVRWVETIKIIKEDADAIIECGPGRVLTGLTKRIDKDVKSFALDKPASMQKFLDSM